MLARLSHDLPPGTLTTLAARPPEAHPAISPDTSFFDSTFFKAGSRWHTNPLLKYSITNALTLFRGIRSIVREGEKIVQEAKPKSLLGVSDTGQCLLGTYRLAQKTGVPYDLFLFDLWRGNFLKPVDRLVAWYYEARVIKGARKIFVAGEGLARYLKRVYNINCIVLRNPLPEPFPADIETESVTNTILYTGSIYWAQEDCIKRLIEAIKGMSIELHIYTPQSKEELARRGIVHQDNVRILPALPSVKISHLQRTASILFLPLTFARKGVKVIETASPGKMTEYLASGRPILVHAPPYSFISQYNKEHASALVVDQPSTAALRAAIEKLTIDQTLVQELTRHGAEEAQKHYRVETNSAILKAELL